MFRVQGRRLKVRPTQIRDILVVATISLALSNLSIWNGRAADSSILPIKDISKVSDLPMIDHEFVFEAIKTGQGLPTHKINAISQTDDGYLWFATPNGVARYDGRVFERILDPYLETSGLEDSTGMATSDGSNNLWISFSRGLARIDTTGLQWFVRSGKAEEARLWNVWKASQAHLWLKGGESLFQFDNGQWSPADTWDEARFGKLQSLLDLGDHGLFCATHRGVWRRDPANATWADIQLEHGESFRNAQRFLYLSDGRILVASDHFLASFDGKDLKPLIRFQLPGRRLHVRFLFQASDERIWLGISQLGVFRVDLEEFSRVDGIERLSRFDSRRVGVGMEDHDGNLWISDDLTGLLRLNQKSIISLEVEGRESIGPSRVECVYLADDGTIWTGTDRGLYQWTDADWARYSVVTQDTWDNDSPSTRSITQDELGRIWFGGKDGLGVLIDGRYSICSFSKSERIPSGPIHCVYRDRQGRIWCGDDRGAFYFDPRFVDFESDDPEEGVGVIGLSETFAIPFPIVDGESRVNCILEDLAGDIWLGTQSAGVLRYHQPSKPADIFDHNHGLPKAPVVALSEGGGRIWVGMGSSLGAINGNTVNVYSKDNGFRIGGINTVTFQSPDLLWIGGNQGITRIQISSLLATSEQLGYGEVDALQFGQRDGMSVPETTGRQGMPTCVDSSGTVWFPTINGVIGIPNTSMPSGFTAPSVCIRHVTVGERKAFESLIYSPTKPPLLEIGSNEERSLRLFFTANTFVDPEAVTFIYKMSGHDKEWRKSAEGRDAVYASLKPGRYDFHVTGINHHGISDTEGARMAIVVHPRYYETALFKSIPPFPRSGC